MNVDRYAILGFEKQLHADEVIGDAPWWVDLDAGTIVFGGELEMSAGLLATEVGGQFLWGWANAGGFPEPVVALGRELPEELSDLDEVAIVAAGALAIGATFTGALDEDTRALLALNHPALALPAPEPRRLAAVFEAASAYVRDWPLALAAYSEQRGVPLDELRSLRG